MLPILRTRLNIFYNTVSIQNLERKGTKDNKAAIENNLFIFKSPQLFAVRISGPSVKELYLIYTINIMKIQFISTVASQMITSDILNPLLTISFQTKTSIETKTSWHYITYLHICICTYHFRSQLFLAKII